MMEKLKEINKIDPNEKKGSWLGASTDKDRWKGLADGKAQVEVMHEEAESETQRPFGMRVHERER